MICEWCGAAYEPSSPNQKYCSLEHTKAAKKQRRDSGTPLVAQTLEPRSCAYCDEVFTPSDPYQMYCREVHQKKATVRRKRLRDGVCPRPDKMAHDSRSPADTRIRKLRLKGMDDGLESYHCCCGKWHIGHPQSEVSQ